MGENNLEKGTLGKLRSENVSATEAGGVAGGKLGTLVGGSVHCEGAGVGTLITKYIWNFVISDFCKY